MVHRSGSTLILSPNDADRKKFFDNNHDDGPPNESQIFTDSQNLPQFLDGLDPCAVSTEIQTKKSTTTTKLPSNDAARTTTTTTTTTKSEISIISTPRTPRSLAQNNKKSRKPLTTPKKTQTRCSNNETPDVSNDDDTNRISPPFRIRSGLRSNSLESNVFLRPNNDAIISGLVTPRRRGRKMRKKRKDVGELKKCKSAEIICDDDKRQVEDFVNEEYPIKLTCSLPLERLSGFLDTILLRKRYNLSDSKLSTAITTDTAEEDSPNLVNNVDNDDSQGHSSHLTTTKSLCLYCDKKFSSQKVRIKHTERVHAISKGRRLSSRNSMSCSSNLSFPGCSYCCYNSNKLKIVTVSDDLKSLFHHLLDFHSDRYFACKLCAIRFTNSEDLETHFDEKHKAGCSSSSSSKIKNIPIKKKGKNSPLDNSFGVDTIKTTTQALHIDTTTTSSSSDKASSLGDDASNDPESTPTKTRRQLKQAMENKPLTTRSCQNVLRNDEAILSRLGVAQNRLPRGRRGIRSRRICNIEPLKVDCLPNAIKTRSKVGRVAASIVMDPMEPTSSRPLTNSRVEVLSCTFDEDFYETVSFNVRTNLSCHLDGKLDSSSTSPSPLSPVATVPTVRSTFVKSPLNADSEIHEATTLTTVTAFPTLLTAEQYGSDIVGSTKIKRPITKHSWKWKWDCVKKYKYVNEGGKIVKKVKQPVAGFRDLSKLDMWTQLTMRSKHEMAKRRYNALSGLNEFFGIGEAAREEKRKQIAQLNAILDTRRLPQIILEQSEQTVIKLEISDESTTLTASSPIGGEITPPLLLPLENRICDLRHANNDYEGFPKMLHLNRRDLVTNDSQEDIILSGEWARPRFYICFGCGAKFDKLKTLEEHKVFRHPYVYSTHYEIVGRELIEGDLFKHFYIPTKALSRYKEYKQRLTKKLECDGKIGFNENSTCGEESMDSVNSVPISYTTGTSRSDCDTEIKTVFASTSSSDATSIEIEGGSVLKFHGNCTKCNRECGGILELYRHMLDCSGDYAWILAKKKKYRYFGVRRKRNARNNLPLPRRKINNKDANVKTENDGNQKPKIYSKPSDAESIRRMLENLPAKRACRQIIPNITKPRVRKNPKGILVKGKNGKKLKGNMANTTVTAITKRILRNHNNKRIYTRHLRQVRTAKQKKQNTTITPKNGKNDRKKNNNVKKSITIDNDHQLTTEVTKNDEEKGQQSSSSCSSKIVVEVAVTDDKEEEEDEEEQDEKKQNDAMVAIVENRKDEKISARSAANRNVVKALGKKTRRFVKKLTDKFQSNTKAFLNKRKSNRRNITASSSSSSGSGSISSSSSNSSTDTAETDVAPPPPPPLSKKQQSDNDRIFGKTTQEENYKKQKENDKNKETENKINTTTKMSSSKKQFLKGNSKILLRKLSFRKSSRTNQLSTHSPPPLKLLSSHEEIENTSQAYVAAAAAANEEICTFNDKTNTNNTTKVVVDENDTLDKKNKNVNISSTNLQTAQTEKVLTKKKKKTFKKILNKFKNNKSNKKFSNSKETENKPDTAVMMNVNENYNDNDIDKRNCEIETHCDADGNSGGGVVGHGSTDDKIINNDYNKEDIVIENCESRNQKIVDLTTVEKAIMIKQPPVNDDTNNISISVDDNIQPLNLTLPAQQPTLQVSPTTKRRSKKLTDCIAMLTGKLQEKLGKPFFESTENLDSALSRQSSTTDISTITPQDTSNISSFFNTDNIISSGGALNLECGKKFTLDDCFERKPPKRKTVTRKIIKKGNNNCSDTTVNKETIFSGGGGYGGSSNSSGGNVVASSTSIVLRPPVLKVSSPKQGTYSYETASTFSSGVCNFKIDKTNNIEIDTAVIPSKIKTPNEQNCGNQKEEKIVVSQIIPASTKLDHVVEVIKTDQQQRSTNLTSISNLINDNNMSSINFYTKFDNSGIEQKDETPMSNSLKGRKKVVRKVGRKKQSSVAKVVDEILIENDTSNCNKSDDCGAINKTSSNIPEVSLSIGNIKKTSNVIVEDENEQSRIASCVVMSMTDKNLPTSCVTTDKKNLPKKKPGRKPKPKPTLSITPTTAVTTTTTTIPENNQDDSSRIDDSEHSHKLWEISKNCDIIPLIKEYDGDKKLNKLFLQHQNDEKIWNKINLTTSKNQFPPLTAAVAAAAASSSPSTHTFSEGCYQSSKISSTDNTIFAVSNDVLLIDNDNNIMKEKINIKTTTQTNKMVGAGSKKVGKRKVKTGNSLNSTKKVDETVDNILEDINHDKDKPLEKKIKLTATEKPISSDVVIAKEEENSPQSTLTTSKYISGTQNKNNSKGRQKKSDVGKNIIKKNNIETVCNVTTIPTTTTSSLSSSPSKLLETNKNVPQAASECGVKQQQIEEITSLPLKRKPGRKKKIKEIPYIEEILNKPQKQIAIEKINTEKLDNKISDIVINKLEPNQNSQQSSTIVKQPETKKYTRKTKLKSDSKPSTSSSDPFVNTKSFIDNATINLHDENQIIANASESVTLKSTLPPLSPNNHHQLISLETIVSEEKSIKKNKKNIKVGNNPKGGKSLNRTNSGKIELSFSVQAEELENNGNILLESSARNMKTTPIKDIRSTKTPPSLQTLNLMNIKEKNVFKEKSLTTTTATLNKSRSSNRNKITKSNEMNKKICHNHALKEVEEIVASFFTDDVGDNDDNKDLLLKKQNAKSEQTSMTDKPIRLDDAEAILSEQHDDDLDDNNEENTITISCNKEKQSNIITPEAMTLLVEKDEVVVSGSNSGTTADDNILQLSSLPVNNPVNVNNENILSICRELSVSLVKLPEDTVNSMKESIISKDNTSTPNTSITKKKGKKIFSSLKQQKNQRNDILDIISNKIDPIAQEKEDILELKLNGPKSKSKQLPAEIDATIIPSDEIFQKINKTMQDKIPESLLEGENGKMEKLDEISSSYSTLKSQDCNSETDTRPDSAAKKQRKRRKNELAAIVADQLLESFKEVDKSKIDDLKMLENLAYEKSEDLLLTGMRLTPTTKRINQPIADNSKDNIINHQPLNNKEMKSQKRKSNEQQNSNRKLLSRSKSQPNLKKLSIESTTTPPSSNQNNVVDSNDMESREKEDDEALTKKRKSSEMCTSISHENLFRSFVKHDEPLKLNAEPLSTYRHNLKICSNFNTTQFEVFSTFKNSFDTFRSLTDFSFMNKKDIVRKSNFIPGSTETSNSVDDSQSLKQEDVTTITTTTATTKLCDTVAAAAAAIGDKIKLSSSSSSSVHKKLKKKLLRKKEKKSENENINQLRTGLELFSFEKETSKNNKDILLSKSFDSKNLNSNDDRQTGSAIISKSHFSFSSPDLFNNVTIKSTDFAQSFNENKKPFLRPSILTATLLETPRTSITLDSSLTTTEVSKSISSRDPRLNKNKMQINSEDKDKKESKYFERRKMGSIRQRRKSESNLKKIQTDSDIEDLNTAFLQPKVRLRSGRKEKKLKSSTPPDNDNIIKPSEPESRTEEDDDNYLSQMAKCVNDKIMSSEDEDDGFEMCNTDSALLLASESGTHPRPSTSMSLRSMPNFNDDQSNAEFLQEDDNTNTELIDMDLEDDMSVYTSFSQDVSRFTGRGGKFGTKRRRRKSILFTRKPKKQNTITDQSEEIFNCDICNKNFRKAAALGKHQMTLTHIAKLSEHEYLNASKVPSVTEEPERQQEPPKKIQSNVDDNNMENKPTAEDSHQSDSIMEMEMEDKESEPIEELVNEGEAAAAMPVETEVPPEPEENVVIEKSSPPPPPPQQHQSTPSVINLLNQSGIEPISSPEQVESNYDRYQNISSRITLSQEERLFYECCNMLKGSETPMVERTYPIVPYSAYDVPNKPVTPKSSERFSYLGSEVTGNFHHGTAYTVKSPMSQSRTSPRHAYPKIDANQFSDISSDSNPAFPRAQPHPNLQSNLNYPSLDLGANKAFSSYAHHPPQSSPGREAQNNSTTGIASFGQAVPTHNYQEPFFSGEGSFTPTHFPNVTDGNPASLTARTFVNEHHVKDFNAGRETIAIPAYPSEIAHDRNQRIPVQQNQNFISPIHSTSSEGSITTTICRMKTKAAMKGYDNFKVSIPTLGLDMQQALERSPHGGCKLTALAEIALGSEAPITSSSSHYPSIQIREEEICDKSKVKPDINEKFAKKYQELIKSNMEPAVPKTPKKKEAIEKIGNKLGFRAKKSNNKGRASKNCEVSKSPEKPKDIYEFDDSEEMEPNEIKSPIRGGRTGKQNEEKIVIPERPFKDIGLDEQQGIKFHKPDELNNQNEESLVSSTSYSDRDDFNYGSMSDNEDANQDEEGSSESESNSSARTTKTIENKCLIMGRIFKKATKNRPEDNSKVDEKITPEQKKKLPTQELNKLFDSLRSEIKETDVHETSPTTAEPNMANPLHADNDIPAQTAAVVVNLSEKPNDSSLLSSKKGVHYKKENPALNEQNNKQQELNQTEVVNTGDLKALERKPSELEAKGRKEIRRRSRRDTTQQHSKEISKLQSELGMSAEEIVNLISEGKRKSQRRCAANRVQKFVETWSSDEYEDFLSTKDIIAFIEEKEKKTRKRKSTSRNSEKKKSTDIVTTSTKVENCSASNTQSKPDKLKEADAERNSNNSKVATNSIENSSNNKKSEKIVDKLLEKITKAQKGVNSSGGKNNKEECAKISDGSSAKIDKEKNHPAVAQSPKSPSLPSIKPSIKTTVETTIQQKKPTLSAKPRLKNRTADSESDFEAELRQSRTKIKKRRKTISFKERESGKKQLKPADASRKLSGKSSKPNNTSKGNSTVRKSSSQADGGGGGGAAASKPQARRKRVASEMLYYWSSSSDEEFGRIEARDDDDDDDIAPEGEHYQQHGWIVGDSHKKLVTLLAIAKGKKVEDCGVKEAGYKKKS